MRGSSMSPILGLGGVEHRRAPPLFRQGQTVLPHHCFRHGPCDFAPIWSVIL